MKSMLSGFEFFSKKFIYEKKVERVQKRNRKIKSVDKV